MQKKTKRSNNCPLIVNQEIYTDPIKKLNILAHQFEKSFDSLTQRMNSTSLLIPITLALTAETEEKYNSPIKMHELEYSLRKLKSSAPGHDLINNQMLKELPGLVKTFLINLFNDSFSSGIIPASWKYAILIPILKPEKDPTKIDSYRPISLLPCIPKLLEKIICRRLNFSFEKYRKFSKNQDGFRKCMSTQEQICRLENFIHTNLSLKKISIVVFIDLSKAYDGIWHTGLLFKLQESGISGRTLNWIKEYLSGRTFKVLLEGVYSRDKKIKTGVPQGAILSPTLFNIMMKDIPHTEGVHNLEYADDIAFMCSGTTVQEICCNLEIHLDKFYKWTKTWGLQINLGKTKAMFFSRKTTLNPIIRLNNSQIQFVQSFRYLGMVLDSPRLSWKDHIQHLSTAAISGVNVMRALTGFHWGADRTILFRLYKSIVRGKLDYGAMFYGSASHEKLKKLDSIQNKCLRIAIGAKKSSPIMSLEVESFIMPLKMHRKFLTIKYYEKIIEFPQWHPLKKELADSVTALNNFNWTNSINVPPTHIRAVRYLQDLGIMLSYNDVFPSFSPIAPWISLVNYLNKNFTPGPMGNISDIMAQSTFQEILHTRYEDHLEIYTDGSKIIMPTKSSSAGVVISGSNLDLKVNYKLHETTTILGCELFGILKALEFIKLLVKNYKSFVIFTDSLSSVEALGNYEPKKYKYLIFKIQVLLVQLNLENVVKIQYIPSHKGIKGNEEADKTANAGHEKHEMETYISKDDKIYAIKEIIVKKWEQQWYTITESLQKGLHLRKIKCKIKYWPWASHKCRLIETLMARMRIGHVNVKQYLHRIGKLETDRCPCGSIETVKHLLMECRLYDAKRQQMSARLSAYKIPLTYQTLLGGGDHTIEKQNYPRKYSRLIPFQNK